MTTVPTYRVTIWMAGDIATALRVIREHAYTEGLCVTVTPSTFVYTGGEEIGFAIGMVNYPRFPSTPEVLRKEADFIARKLLPACNQRTCLIVADDETHWIVVEPPGATP